MHPTLHTHVAVPLLTAVLSILLAGYPAVVSSQAAAAMAQPQHFTAHAVTTHAVSAVGTRDAFSVEPVEIAIQRWSTDSERERVVKTLKTDGVRAVVTMLEKAPRVGILNHLRNDAALPQEMMRQNIEYAYETTGTDGERRIILATGAAAHSLSVIEIRFARNGIGEGRIAEGRAIAISKDQRTIELRDANAAQVYLTDVRER